MNLGFKEHALNLFHGLRVQGFKVIILLLSVLYISVCSEEKKAEITVKSEKIQSDMPDYSMLIRNYPSFKMNAVLSYSVKYHDETELKIIDEFDFERAEQGDWRFIKDRLWEKRREGLGENRKECILKDGKFWTRNTYGKFILWDDALNDDIKDCETIFYKELMQVYDFFKQFQKEKRTEGVVSIISFATISDKKTDEINTEFVSFFKANFIPVHIEGTFKFENHVPVMADMKGRFKLLKGEMEADFEIVFTHKLSKAENIQIKAPDQFMSSKRKRITKMLRNVELFNF